MRQLRMGSRGSVISLTLRWCSIANATIMRHNFIYRHRLITIHMRRDDQQWTWRHQLDGIDLGEGHLEGSAQRALHEAAQAARLATDEWINHAPPQ